MHLKKIPLTTALPFFPQEEQVIITKQLSSVLNDSLSMGPFTEEFETKFASFCGTRYGVAFPSCTSALEVSLKYLGVGPGDEVIVPCQTFVATAASVCNVGARPIFCDINPDTLSMDHQKAHNLINSKTKGIIIVHYGGYIDPQLEEFIFQIKNKDLFIIEDAAHAHGSELNGKKAGSFGDIGCFSFYPTKVMTTGEGGFLTTDEQNIHKFAKSMQNRGRDLDSEIEVYEKCGTNLRFTEFSAILGLSQLRSLPYFLQTRRSIASLYLNELSSNKLLTPIPSMLTQSLSSYWRFPVLSKHPFKRDEFAKFLKSKNIFIDWSYAPGVHLQPVFKNKYGFSTGSLQFSENILSKLFCLPMHARLSTDDATYVMETVLLNFNDYII